MASVFPFTVPGRGISIGQSSEFGNWQVSPENCKKAGVAVASRIGNEKVGGEVQGFKGMTKYQAPDCQGGSTSSRP